MTARPVKDYFAFTRALQEEGLLPPECVDVSIDMPADGLFQLRYTVNILTEDLPKLARAFQAKFDAERERT